MENEMAFPNPIERTDLPVRSGRKWKITLAVVVVLGLILLALPWVLNRGIGRTMVGNIMQRKLRMNVYFLKFQTSWWSGTTFHELAIGDPRQRIGAKKLHTQCGLWGLLTGDYKLGDAQAEGLRIDYVVDYGDGLDLIDKMHGGRPQPNEKPRTAPDFSGKLSFTDGTFSLTRGQVQQKQTLPVEFASFEVTDVSGTFEIDRLDKPWTLAFTGVAKGPTPDHPDGTVKVDAKLALGEGRLYAGNRVKGEFAVEMKNVPTGPLAWVIHPDFSRADYDHMFGQTLEKFDLAVKVADGKVTVEKLEAVGETRDGKTAHVTAACVIDVTKPTHVMTLENTFTASGRVSRTLGRTALGCVSPFLRDAVDSTGWFEVSLAKLKMPYRRTQAPTSGEGTIAVSAARVAPDKDWVEGNTPSSLTGQWQMLTGNTAAQATVKLAETKFVLDGGRMTPAPHELTIDDSKVSIAGDLLLRGRVKMSAGVTLPPATAAQMPELAAGLLGVPLVGQSVELARLDLAAAKAALAPPVFEKLTALMAEHAKAQKERHYVEHRRKVEQPLEDSAAHLRNLTGGGTTTPPARREDDTKDE